MSVLAGLDPDVAYPATPSVPDSDLHSLVRFLCYGALRGHFAGLRGCFVGQDLNVYYRPLPARRVVAPDVFVCFGVDPRRIQEAASYRLWEVGAPPAFVLEVASERTYRNDLDDKPAAYLEMGVSEYWRLDPTGGEFYTPALQGDSRAGGAWAPIAVGADDGGRLAGRSGVLGLDLYAEGRRLRFRDPRSGHWLADPDEARQALDTESAARRAAEDRAEAAEAEVAALRVRLDEQT
ncbi:MAG: Uma2 family endonuclease [Acidobacteria bacterium]|nr:Uma2 family endonuclease [Acidobacteriota bacterium]